LHRAPRRWSAVVWGSRCVVGLVGETHHTCGGHRLRRAATGEAEGDGCGSIAIRGGSTWVRAAVWQPRVSPRARVVSRTRGAAHASRQRIPQVPIRRARVSTSARSRSKRLVGSRSISCPASALGRSAAPWSLLVHPDEFGASGHGRRGARALRFLGARTARALLRASPDTGNTPKRPGKPLRPKGHGGAYRSGTSYRCQRSRERQR